MNATRRRVVRTTARSAIATLGIACALAAGCGGDDESSDTLATATPSHAEVAGGKISGTTLAALSDRSLVIGDLPGRWETSGPEPLTGMGLGTTLGPICPVGTSVTLDDPSRTIGADSNAIVEWRSLDEMDLHLTELLIHDVGHSVFDAFAEMFGSCVGPSFEQGSDPVETVQYEPLDVAMPGDRVAAFVERWGTGGELDGGEVGHALLGFGDVVVVISLDREQVSDPYDHELLVAAARAAVERLGAG